MFDMQTFQGGEGKSAERVRAKKPLARSKSAGGSEQRLVHAPRARTFMRSGVLASVLEEECKLLFPPAPAATGPQLSWGALVVTLLGAFLLGCCLGAAALGSAGWLVWQWWSGEPPRHPRPKAALAAAEQPADSTRLSAYRRR